MIKQIIRLVTKTKYAVVNEEATQDVTFCEGCGEVCPAACRSEAILNRAKEKYSSYPSAFSGRFQPVSEDEIQRSCLGNQEQVI